MPDAPHQPQFSVRADGARDGSTVVAVAGEVDVATAGELEAFVRGRMGGEGGVLLDLRDVTFLDSSGVRALAAVARHAAEGGGDLRVRSELREPVRQVLELTGMLQVLPFAG